MNIIRSTIIDPASDSFWEDASVLVATATPRPLLILAEAYPANGKEDVQLQKMLGACGLLPDQYNIIQLDASQPAPWHQLREQLNPKVVFLIGINPGQLGISAMFQLNTANNFNGCLWLPTLSLSDLEQNAELKKQLWLSGMKPLFVDKAYGDVLAK